MRVGLFCLGLVFAPLSALAQDTTALVPAASGGVSFSTSISLNLPLMAPDQAGKLAEEELRRRDLYARAVGECAVLLESVAKSCTITSINVSSQTNSNPGQPDYLYASASISMQVELK